MGIQTVPTFTDINTREDELVQSIELILKNKRMESISFFLNIFYKSDEWIVNLYNQFKENSKIKWKESIKKIVNIEIPTIKGLDD